MSSDEPRQAEFRRLVRAMYFSLQQARVGESFSNFEGGSVEQQRDQRLQLHHCANYAAVLTVLKAASPKPQATSKTEGSSTSLRILELGCGTGALSCAFARLMPGNWQLTATDYSGQLVKHAHRHFSHERLRFDRLDLKELRPELLAGFDAVLFLEVIEHLPRTEAATLFRTLYAGLKPGACLVLTTLDRTPFPRPFSAYAPHHVEYTYDSLVSFLTERQNCLFERVRVMRLVSPRIADEAVRAEQRGGYLANRMQRYLLGLAARSASFRRLYGWTTAVGFRLYSRLPGKRLFDLDRYLDSLEFVQEAPQTRGQDSFGLVAVLEKAGEA